MPFDFYKPVDFATFSVSYSVVVVPAFIELCDRGLGFFTILIHGFLVESQVTVIS
jgi:hypothetical protein